MYNSVLDKKIAALETESELKREQNEIAKLRALDSSYFCGRNHFDDDNCTKKYLVFQLVHKYFKRLLLTTSFKRGNQKDCLVKVLNFLLHLITVLLQR